MGKNRYRLAEMLDEGLLDANQLASDLLSYLSEDECEDFVHKNGIELFPEEEKEPEEFEFSDEDEVNEAFAEQWTELCAEVPAYRTDKPARRMAFTCFVDDLQREGRISDELAYSVTLQSDE